MFTNKEEQHLRRFFIEKVENCQICKGRDPVCICRDAYCNEFKFLKAGIKLEYLPFELSNLESPDIQQMKTSAETFIKNLDANIKDGMGLFLHGGHGTGKTTLGTIILKAAIRKGYTAYSATLADCINLVTSSWGGSTDPDKTTYFKQLQDKIDNADIFLIDDIGGLEIKTGKNKELIISTFTTIFRARSNSRQSTIVTSNLSPQEMYDAFGSLVYSTMMQYHKFVDFPSEADFRQTLLSPQRNDAKKVKTNQRKKGTGYQI